MNGRGSRAKGSNFELKIAAKFSERFRHNFRRTPLSGGFDKSMIQGDIFCDNKKFSLVVECKNHRNFSLPQWWKQVRDDAPRGKIPLLVFYFSGTYHSTKKYVFKKNQTRDIVVLRLKDYEKLTRDYTIDAEDYVYYKDNKLNVPKYLNDIVNLGKKEIIITTPSLTGTSNSYILLPLDDFLVNIRKPRCYKRIIALRKIAT